MCFAGKRGEKAGKIECFFLPFHCRKTRSLNSNSVKMPKFKRVCKNPLHETWSKNDEGKVVNLQAHGFITVANALQQYVEAESGKKMRHKINHLCSTCLKTCSTRRPVEELLNSLQKMNLRMWKIVYSRARYGNLESAMLIFHLLYVHIWSQLKSHISYFVPQHAHNSMPGKYTPKC